MMEWLSTDLWMIINLGILAFIILLALFSYFKKDPTIELLTKVLLVLVKVERARISQDPEGKGTDPEQKSTSMVSNPTETHTPSKEGELILMELEEKLEGLL